MEATIRKIHRTVGVYLVGFLALQAITGLCISLWTLTGSPGNSFWFTAMAWIHHEWNPVGSVYRILLGALVIGPGPGRPGHLPADAVSPE